MARLKEQYKAEVAPALYKKFGYKSTMQIPKIDKMCIRDRYRSCAATNADRQERARATSFPALSTAPIAEKKCTTCLLYTSRCV